MLIDIVLGYRMTLLAISIQVNKPQEDPVILKSHEGEVTAVDWYSFLPECCWLTSLSSPDNDLILYNF